MEYKIDLILEEMFATQSKQPVPILEKLQKLKQDYNGKAHEHITSLDVLKLSTCRGRSPRKKEKQLNLQEHEGLSRYAHHVYDEATIRYILEEKERYGLTNCETAVMFGCSRNTIKKWLDEYR
ncbi:MAG: hypothetical protein FJY10_05755 [Bacteroidetes bacterium]|nr:hypothetical protein [Bacteroidota bacterium]